MFVDTEAMSRAAARMIQAAERIERSVSNLEDTRRRLCELTEPGYGNNVTRLIELLEAAEAARGGKPKPE